MILRAPLPDDAADILAIVQAHGLPPEWTWPEGKHGIVAEHDGSVVAFCILSESLYGLVIEELWEQKTRAGIAGLGQLSREIEAIAQRLADERGEPLSCGGIVRLELTSHVAALRKRGYSDEAVVLSKVFRPAAVPPLAVRIRATTPSPT